jgi:hypothetical protein
MTYESTEMKCYIAHGNTPEDAERLRSKGWTTLHALTFDENPQEQATLHECTHVLENGKLTAL